MLMAEMNLSDIPYRLSRFSIFFFPPLTFIAFLLMSFPAENQHHAQWSFMLLKLYVLIAPENSDIERFLPTLGAQLLGFTALCSPHLRILLTNRICLWLGKVSLPLYLLHGMIMRSVLSWVLFAGESLIPQENEVVRPDNGEKEMVVTMRYPMPSFAMHVVAVAVFSVALALAAQFWTMKIEPQFGKMTKKAEDIMFGKEPVQSLFRQD